MLIMMPALLAAQTTHPLVQELRTSVAREYDRFLAVVDQSDVAYEMTVQGMDETGHPTGPKHLSRVVSSNPSVGGTRVVSTDLTTGGSSTVCGNPNYAFTVTRNSTNAPPYIAGYRPTDPPKMANDPYVRAGFGSMHNTVIELMDGPYVRSQNVDEQTTDGHRYVVARFTRTFKDYDTPLPVWMVFDPKQDWRVVQYAEYFSWGVVNVSIRYQRGLQGILFPAEVDESEHAYYAPKWTETRVRLQLPTPCHLPPRDFTLEAFGLEVPSNGAAAPSTQLAGNTTQAGPSDATPPRAAAAADEVAAADGRRFYVVLFIAAAGVALIAAAMVFRRKPPLA